MVATIFGTLIVFAFCCAALMLGQFFGRPPIEGRCRPRDAGDGGCGAPDCCQLDDGKPER